MTNYSLYNFLLGDSYNEDNFKIPTEDDLFFDKWYASDGIRNHFYNEFLHDIVIGDFKKLVLENFGEVDTIENEYRKTEILEKHGVRNTKKAKAFYVFEGIEKETYREQTSEKDVAIGYSEDFYHDYYEALRESFYKTEYHSFYLNQDDEIYFDDDTIFDYMFLYHNEVSFSEYMETLGMLYLNPAYKDAIIDKFLERLIENTQTIKPKK